MAEEHSGVGTPTPKSDTGLNPLKAKDKKPWIMIGLAGVGVVVAYLALKGKGGGSPSSSQSYVNPMAASSPTSLTQQIGSSNRGVKNMLNALNTQNAHILNSQSQQSNSLSNLSSGQQQVLTNQKATNQGIYNVAYNQQLTNMGVASLGGKMPSQVPYWAKSNGPGSGLLSGNYTQNTGILPSSSGGTLQAGA